MKKKKAVNAAVAVAVVTIKSPENMKKAVQIN